MESLVQFASDHTLLTVAARFVTALTLANEIRLRAIGGTDLTPQQAVSRINGGAQAIDLRPLERYRTGHIVNAVNVAADSIADEAKKKLAGFRDKPVLIYDDNGFGTTKVARQLRALEFKDVATLRGGLTAWTAENLPLESGK